MKCIACESEARSDLAFCIACDAKFAEDHKALKAFEERTGYQHWLLVIRMAPPIGGITVYGVGGTSRMDRAPHLQWPGAWINEITNAATSRMQVVLIDRDGIRLVIRDKRFDDRIARAQSPTSELERAARLDDPKDPIWLSIAPRTW